MIGSIIGDIVGSIYEFHNIKTKDFSLFSDRVTTQHPYRKLLVNKA